MARGSSFKYCDTRSHPWVFYMQYLDVPQFDGPVKGGGEEVLAEVDGAGHLVAVDAGHRAHVTLKHVRDACFAANRRITE